MGFWIFMLCNILLIPGMMLGIGLWFRRTAPGKINYVFGYRTKRSMKNQETWDFAHKKCGEVWSKWGIWVLIFSVIPMFFLLGKDPDAIGRAGTALILLQVVPLLLSILPVEKALKENFDEDGYRRKSAP